MFLFTGRNPWISGDADMLYNTGIANTDITDNDICNCCHLRICLLTRVHDILHVFLFASMH